MLAHLNKSWCGLLSLLCLATALMVAYCATGRGACGLFIIPGTPHTHRLARKAASPRLLPVHVSPIRSVPKPSVLPLTVSTLPSLSGDIRTVRPTTALPILGTTTAVGLVQGHSPSRPVAVRNQRLHSNTKNASASCLAKEKAGTPLIAVGTFTFEQLTMGSLQFASLLAAAKAWKRDVVLPSIAGRQFIGLFGRQYARRNTNPGMETAKNQPLPIDRYYNLPTTKHHLNKLEVRLVSQREAQQQCNKQWTVLFLAHNYPWGPMLCAKNKTLKFRAAATFERLMSQKSENLTIEKDCAWILQCLPPEVKELQLEPFCNVVCAGAPKSMNSVHFHAATLKKQIDQLSTKCLLVVQWFGGYRHQMYLDQINPQWFYPSQYLRNMSREILRSSGLASGFIALHLRAEYILRTCTPEPKPPYKCTGRTNKNKLLRNVCSGCISSVKRQMSVIGNLGLPILVSSDWASNSFLPELKVIQNETDCGTVLSIHQHFAHVPRIVWMEELQNSSNKAKHKDLYENAGLVSLLDLEILSSATKIFLVGGGNFQKRIREVHQRKHNNVGSFSICSFVL